MITAAPSGTVWVVTSVTWVISSKNYRIVQPELLLNHPLIHSTFQGVIITPLVGLKHHKKFPRYSTDSLTPSTTPSRRRAPFMLDSPECSVQCFSALCTGTDYKTIAGWNWSSENDVEEIYYFLNACWGTFFKQGSFCPFLSHVAVGFTRPLGSGIFTL